MTGYVVAGPVRVPAVGILPFVDQSRAHKYMVGLSDTYGPVVGVFFGNRPAVFVNGWKAVKESLMNDDLNGRPGSIYFSILYNGVQRGECTGAINIVSSNLSIISS